MNVIAISGSGGGVGVTTVAAQLAMGLAARGRRSIAFDASPGNALRLHFGMAWQDGGGLAPQVLSGRRWHEAAYRSSGGVDFVPFGRTGGAMSAHFDSWLAERPGWLAARLDELDEPDDGFAIVDCPLTQSALRSQALAAAKLAIIVLNPDALSYALAGAARDEALYAGAGEVVFLLNKFDATRMLDRDILALMRADLRGRLLPVITRLDESLREALANKQTVFDYAPSCEGATNFAALSMWLISRFPASRENAA